MNETVMKNKIELAIIGAPHGTKGEVRVKTYTENPLDLGAYGALYDKNGRSYLVETIRVQKNIAIVRFKDIATRNAAEAIKNIKLYIERSQLPDDLAEDEFYQTDLIGLAVKNGDNEIIGKVTAMFDFGGGQLLDIQTLDKKSVLIPFSLAAVPEVSLQSGFVRVDPVAAGLIKDEEEDDAEEKAEQ